MLKEIDQQAIIPDDLQSQINRGVIVSFSFSMIDDAIGKIFEPGAPAPSKRLLTVQASLKQGLLTGISMMPLLPFITDTTEYLQRLFSTFQAARVDYVLPATLTLFGSEKADSKTLLLNAIRKHYPHLEARYQQYFASGTQMPAFYQKAFYAKMKELGEAYGLPNRILDSTARIAIR